MQLLELNIVTIATKSIPKTSTYKKNCLFLGGIICHPPYSPDIALLDYHLFRSLQNYLKETAFVTQKDVETDICEFYESQNNFWRWN